MVGDAAYVGERLRDVDGRITWTSRLKATSVLHELPPPRTGRSGRPRTRDARLGTPRRCRRPRDDHEHMAHHEEVAAALEAAAEWTASRGGCAAAAALLERAALLTPEEEPRAEGIAPLLLALSHRIAYCGF